ncbi:helix-turn-helix domain-containing protein [Chromobacterium phragmitis]|uniref:Helix-turn-helix domain-containing protein n=1 Tax=Chromobacterium phragmitis TaxID=2202141 RepID=A0ABV0J0S3_9NEIS
MIGFRIKEARIERKHSQQWLADEIGVFQSSVSAWEIGRSEPTTENLSRIALVLRVSHDWLATGRGAMELSYVPAEIPPAELPLGEDQKNLLELFEQLPRDKRATLLQFMRDWLKK